MYGIEVKIRFNPAVVEVLDSDTQRPGVQLAPGEFPNPATGFVAVNKVNSEAGEAHYTISELNPAPPASGSGVVVRVTFRGRAEGDSAVTLFDVSLVSVGGAITAPRVLHGQVMVRGVAAGSPSATPLPQTPSSPDVSPARTPINVPTPVSPAPAAPPGQPAPPGLDETPPPSPDAQPVDSSERPPGLLPATIIVQRQISSPPTVHRTAPLSPTPGPISPGTRPAVTATEAMDILGVNVTPEIFPTHTVSERPGRVPTLPGAATVPLIAQGGLSPVIPVGVALLSFVVVWLWWQQGRR